MRRLQDARLPYATWSGSARRLSRECCRFAMGYLLLRHTTDTTYNSIDTYGRTLFTVRHYPVAPNLNGRSSLTHSSMMEGVTWWRHRSPQGFTATFGPILYYKTVTHQRQPPIPTNTSLTLRSRRRRLRHRRSHRHIDMVATDIYRRRRLRPQRRPQRRSHRRSIFQHRRTGDQRHQRLFADQPAHRSPTDAHRLLADEASNYSNANFASSPSTMPTSLPWNGSNV